MSARPAPAEKAIVAVPIPRVVLALRADGSIEVLADRPCRLFIAGGLLGDGHAELPPPRVGWPLVTAALGEAEAFVNAARCAEGRPCDTEDA